VSAGVTILLGAIVASGPGVLEGALALAIIGAEPDCDTPSPCFHKVTCESSGGQCQGQVSRCKSGSPKKSLCEPANGGSVCNTGPCVATNNDTCSGGCGEAS
jgi:hypothetical protein